MKVSVSPLVLLARAVICAALVAGASAARAQDVQSLADTVSRLERQLQTLERTVYRSGGAVPAAPSGAPAASSGGAADSAPASNAPLNIRIGEIEEQLRQITGQIENVGFDVRRLETRFEKLESDIDFRLSTLEKGGAAGVTPEAALPAGTDPASNSPAVAPQPAGTIGTLTETQLRNAEAGAAASGAQTASTGAAPTAPAAAVELPAGAPAVQYEYAFAYLMRRDFPGAEAAFRQFVEAHPKDPLAGNAQYWLGETYYVRNDFPNAARTFAEGFQRYPDSGKAADNLLKLGLSLAALERKDDACITFTQLASAYPKSPANILQRAKREREKLGCS